MAIFAGQFAVPGVAQMHYDYANLTYNLLYQDGTRRTVCQTDVDTYGPSCLLQNWQRPLVQGAHTYGVSWPSTQSAGGLVGAGGGGNYSAIQQQYFQQHQQQLFNPYNYPYQGQLGALGGAAATGLGGVPNAQAAYQAAYQQLEQILHPSPLPREAAEVGKIIGWRAWRQHVTSSILFGVKYELKSLSQNYIWQPGKIVTGNPEDHGDEGVYAFKDRAGLMNEFGNYPNLIIGTIAMWGKVVEHEEGYRAEKAEIVSIRETTWDLGDNNKLLEEYRKRYLKGKDNVGRT